MHWDLILALVSSDRMTTPLEGPSGSSTHRRKGCFHWMMTNIAVYMPKDCALEELRASLQNPNITPSQVPSRRHFAAALRPNGINTTTGVSIDNATNITVVTMQNTVDGAFIGRDGEEYKAGT